MVVLQGNFSRPTFCSVLNLKLFLKIRFIKFVRVGVIHGLFRMVILVC